MYKAMKKYKQTKIPSVKIPDEWKILSGVQLRKIVYEHIKKNNIGFVRNNDTQINIAITVSSARKTAYGEAIYLKKAALALIIKDVLKYAKYNNFGKRKDSDSNDVLGYLNFKCKVKIDGKTECARIAVRFMRGGKFYYNVEINKKPTLAKD